MDIITKEKCHSISYPPGNDLKHNMKIDMFLITFVMLMWLIYPSKLPFMKRYQRLFIKLDWITLFIELKLSQKLIVSAFYCGV